MDLSKTIYYTLEGIEVVFSSAEWCLDTNIMMKKHELGIPIWNNHKILKNYEPFINPPATATSASISSDSPEPTDLPHLAEQDQDEPQTPELQSLPVVLDQHAHNDLLPTSDASAPLADPVPPRVRRRSNGKKTK